MIRLLVRRLRKRGEWRQRHHVFLIRRYQVASADRAGDGWVTSRLLVAGLPMGAWGEPFWPHHYGHQCFVYQTTWSCSTWLSCSDCGTVSFVPNQDGQSGLSVLDNNFNCWGAQTACGRSVELFCESASWIPDVQHRFIKCSTNTFTGSFMGRKKDLIPNF